MKIPNLDRKYLLNNLEIIFNDDLNIYNYGYFIILSVFLLFYSFYKYMVFIKYTLNKHI